MSDLIARQPRAPLPTKAQIEAISKVDDLEAMRDDIDRRIARIETDLDFRDGTDDWEARALSALSVHRYTANLLSRRIKALRQAGKSPFAGVAKAAVAMRERTNCHPESWRLIDGGKDEPTAETVEECDKEIERLTTSIEALEADRADEVSFAPGARDESWLAEANSALRKAKGTRHNLALRKAGLRRELKLEHHRLWSEGREQAFVAEAREILPRETYMMLWDRVDRRSANPPTGKAE